MRFARPTMPAAALPHACVLTSHLRLCWGKGVPRAGARQLGVHGVPRHDLARAEGVFSHIAKHMRVRARAMAPKSIPRTCHGVATPRCLPRQGWEPQVGQGREIGAKVGPQQRRAAEEHRFDGILLRNNDGRG